MREGHSTVTRRQDYAPPAFWIDSVDLTFDLEPTKTRVLNKMVLRRNPDVPAQPLRLDGDELNLARVVLAGQGCSFRMDGQTLVLENLPEGTAPFELEVFTTCNPEKNSKLMGLFMSGGDFFTQCEAEGFRRITYFLDRPDVMATYTVTLRADRKRYPVLLSNGNLVESGDLDGGRHFATWHDPFKKPSYLFAVVAGQLVAREQRIVTRSGREHLLQVYVRPGDLDQTEHAMNSLIHSVLWDEARFGLALDLDRFMVVATSDFNAGAMENKGLNIFNTKYVLAKPSTATDSDFDAIESVIGHEYFHNWTGDRVTCRDWFQLSLKEGLTVFRDQEFSQDLAGTDSARAVKRIQDVINLRAAQFPEDAGPMAHPVRPDEYLEISNFYTTTIYEKGAEVVRMYQTLVGRDGFRKGVDLYFQRHDGQAVTCDDFAQAMADANPDSDLARLLPQFKRWYSQAGTPVLKAEGRYDAAARSYTLTLSQTCPPTPGQPHKEPFVIPVRLGLVGADGRDLPLQLDHWQRPVDGNHTLVLTEPETRFTFVGVDSEPVPSLLRGFSAPVELDWDATPEQLLHLLAHDSDPFTRWEAGQRLALSIAIEQIAGPADGSRAEPLNDAYLAALRALLREPDLDPAFKALVLTLPDEDYIADQLDEVDPQRIHAVCDAMELQLAKALQTDWAWAYDAHENTGAYSPDPVSAGRRELAGLALHMLCLAATHGGELVWPGKAYQRFKDAGNMTDRLNALEALVYSGHDLAGRALQRYYELFRHEPLALDKWFALQAHAPDHNGSVLPQVRTLMKHPDFNLRTPNRARSLVFSYCNGNPAAFHRTDAAGYAFWADRVLELDTINPQVAARLARAMDAWARLVEPYRSAAREALARVAAKPSLSNDVREVVTRALAEHAPAEVAHAEATAPALDNAAEARSAPTPDTEPKTAS
ncbi:aminopeptidase N [Ottowia sp. GY511]|uniref:Aminopeptidase N n=1 Tax=Ottowia flava TaxID=2675430 RepID=A0ABW4KTC4_9BURK|nr:aminopeptidase N [Ottowia sp. GY511]TXK23554.1 aminopeptidase N [Ottowia sp. GY511]